MAGIGQSVAVPNFGLSILHNEKDATSSAAPRQIKVDR
jgi:hypothetical protein